MTTTGATPSDVELRHLAAIVASSDDAIISKDRDAIIRSWNPGAERLYGWTTDEAVGRPISIIIPPSRAGEERRILERIIVGDRVDHYETERITRDGRIVWVSLTISPVRDATGEVVAASVIARDVTERRAIERERDRLLAETEVARQVAERSRARLAFLARASEAITESLEPGPSLARLARLFATELGHRCALHLFTAGRLRPRALAERAPDGARDVAPAGGGRVPPLVADAVRGTDARLHADVDEHLVWPRGTGRVAAIVAPIRSHGEALGALTVIGPIERGFGPDDVALVQEVARRTAAAVENWRAFEAEHEAAVTLQRSLLPRALPDLPGVAVAARYVPAAPSLNVGGDWYDVVATPDGRVIGAIGDVAGRGLGAAAMMGQLRNALRAYVLDGHEPAGVVERVNRLNQTFERPDMATLALLTIAPDGHDARLVLAGHPPPFVRHADGRVERLAARAGPPVGAAPHSIYDESPARLGPGTTVVLFTDGLVERRGESLDVGLARLERVLADAPEDVEALCDFVLAQMADGTRERDDDIALLALCPLPVAADEFAFAGPADYDAPASIRRELRRWLEAGPGDARALLDVVAAASEAVANVVEHAYPGRGGMVDVSARRDRAGHVDVVVRDFGRWRPARETGGGRGLGVIRALVDDVRVDAGVDGTTVVMRRRLTGDRHA